MGPKTIIIKLDKIKSFLLFVLNFLIKLDNWYLQFFMLLFWYYEFNITIYLSILLLAIHHQSFILIVSFQDLFQQWIWIQKIKLNFPLNSESIHIHNNKKKETNYHLFCYRINSLPFQKSFQQTSILDVFLKKFIFSRLEFKLETNQRNNVNDNGICSCQMEKLNDIWRKVTVKKRIILEFNFN